MTKTVEGITSVQLRRRWSRVDANKCSESDVAKVR